MGNALSYQDFVDTTGPGKGVEFFKGLRLKTVEMFMSLMRQSDTDLNLDLSTHIASLPAVR